MLCTLSACTPRLSLAPCNVDDECGVDEVCRAGFCAPGDRDLVDGGTRAADAGVRDAGAGDAGARDAGDRDWHFPEHTARVRVEVGPADAPLVDFPVAVSLEEEPSVINVVDVQGVPLDFHREADDPGVLVWIRVPTLDLGATLLVYFGGPGEEPEAARVFEDFESVYHLNDAPSMVHLDAVGNFTGSADQLHAPEDGPFGRALAFDGTGGIDLPSAPLRVRPGQILSFSIVARASPGAEASFFWGEGFCMGPRISLDESRVRTVMNTGPCNDIESFDQLFADGNYMDDAWHHYGVNLDRQAGEMELYIDGELISFSQLNLDLPDDGQVAHLGQGFDGNEPLVGGLDEFRVSRVRRPAAWLRAEAELASGALLTTTRELRP